MNMVTTVGAAAAVLILSACGTGAITATTSGAPTTPASPAASSSSAAPTEDPVVDPTPSEPETGGYTESKFGTTASFTADGTNSFTVKVNAPTKGKCQYSYSSCSKPETGDRVVTTKVVVKNTSSEAIEISSSLFVLEFPDGTRMETSDGSSFEYQPDNAMDYGHKIRPGGTYTSTLTFEAPKGPFTIIMLTNTFDGEDLHGWK